MRFPYRFLALFPRFSFHHENEQSVVCGPLVPLSCASCSIIFAFEFLFPQFSHLFFTLAVPPSLSSLHPPTSSPSSPPFTAAAGAVFSKFRDASAVAEQHDIHLRDCLRAMALARSTNIFSLPSFNLNEYDYYSSFDNGDINVIVPGKLLAFRCKIPPLSDGMLANSSCVFRVQKQEQNSTRVSERYFHIAKTQNARILSQPT